MADFQIGDNLYADNGGRYYSLNKGVKAYTKSPYETAQDKINSMYDAQRNSQLNQLKAQRTQAVTGFNQQKKDLAPQYQSQRNQADVTNAQNTTRLRELMAANGINMSGENITAQANMNSSRQNSFNDINNNEQQAYGAIDRQIADVNDPSKDQAINDAIAAERSKSLVDAYSQAQQQAYQQQVDWRNYAMQKAQFDIEQQMRQLQLQKAKSGGSGGSGGGSGGRGGSSRKKNSSGSSGSLGSPSLDKAYKEYLAQKTMETKYKPRPFSPAQKHARPIY